MFGRKQRKIEFFEGLDEIRMKQLGEYIRENMNLKEQLNRKCSTHNAFAIVEDYLLQLSEELRQDGSKILFREKHKNSEGNIFVSEKERDATQIDNITRALYEIEKSERRQNEKTKLDF